MISRAARKCDDAVGGNGELTTGVRTIQPSSAQSLGHLLQVPIKCEASNSGHRLVSVLNEETTAVGAPLSIVNRPIELVADRVIIASVTVHDIHTHILITEKMVIE